MPAGMDVIQQARHFTLIFEQITPHFRTPSVAALYRVEQIRALEQQAQSISTTPLMELAGAAAADWVRTHFPASAPILCLAGQGNNGGDALVLARLLKQAGYPVSVVLLGDVGQLPNDAARAYQAWIDAGGLCQKQMPAEGRWRLIVDGLFGIGLARPLEGLWRDAVLWINAQAAPVLALDIPSGLHAETGAVLGVAADAKWTISFIGNKPGLLTHDGPDHAGEVMLVPLVNIDSHIGAAGYALSGQNVAQLLPARRKNSHKGTFGSVGVIGGAAGMVGAALLAGRAALKLGAGRVTLGLLDPDAPRVDMQQPELMLRAAEDLFYLDHITAFVVGPGLGKSADAVHCLEMAICRPLPLVLDADALNLIADKPELADKLARRQAPTALTPHPAEAARLLGMSTDEVQADRINRAELLAHRFNCAVVLKGCGSIITRPQGAFCINTSGNPGLAGAGQGDVLAGIVAAMLAQGLDAFEALQMAVYLHGAAADKLVGDGVGPVGLTASEVIVAAREVLRGLGRR
jgi:hydroxyethylthiazole kinase-like uncharacterized protein yjeF